MLAFIIVAKFAQIEQRSEPGAYVPRCWIHTHPRFKAFRSSTDIIQLFGCACQNPHSFGIVIFPRGEGLKVLCVRLTSAGFEKIQGYYKEAELMGINATEATEYVTLRNSRVKIKVLLPNTVQNVGHSAHSCRLKKQ